MKSLIDPILKNPGIELYLCSICFDYKVTFVSFIHSFIHGTD